MSVRRRRALEIQRWKGGEPFPIVTAYDAAFGRICEDAGIDVILVGDSYGMVVLGYDSTSQVELDDMVRASASVARGTQRAHIVADLPFGTYEASDELAVASAVTLVKAGRAGSVKLEGNVATARRAAAIVASGIPVMAHIGVLPQTAALSSGYRSQSDVERLLEDARAFEAAGAYAIVLEKVAPATAAAVTRAVQIPTIGIGSGPDCDGQVLVLHDVLGLFPNPPSFAKQYANLGSDASAALRRFGDEVRTKAFPVVDA